MPASGDPIANRYHTLRLLGEGAMGRVWLVRDEVDGDEVALKAIAVNPGAVGGTQPNPVFATDRPEAGPDKSVLQFKQEFRLMTQLRHPNCCRVFDFGVSAQGEPYFTMEVVPGQGIDEIVPVDAPRARDILAQLLLALADVHRHGFVHCDIKSANVRVRPDGMVKLMDFGLMEYTGRHTGMRGTVAYLAPEMIRREPIDQRADLYAVGCLAYEMLAGRPPFLPGAGGMVEVLRAHAATRPEPISRYRRGMDDRALEAVIQKLLAKEPTERYQSANDVLRDLGHEVPAEFGGKLLTAPFVGQEAPRARLKQALEALASYGEGGAIWVSAPAGAGKSRLVEEFRFEAQLEGLPYARASLTGASGAPYAPFTQLLRALLPLARTREPNLLSQHAPVLVKLLPELRAIPAPEMDTPRAEMLRLHGAITALIQGLAQKQPLIMVLSNWQWADDRSRDLMSDLLRKLPGTQALLVVNSREATPPHEAFEALALQPLTDPEVERMVRAMLGEASVPAAFAGEIATLSKGNPLFVERLLEHLVKTGILHEADGHWDTTVDLHAVELPTDLADLMAAGFDDLTPDARRVAELVALADQPVDIDLAKAVAALDEAALFEALEELEAGSVLVRDQQDRYILAREPFRDMLVAGLDPAAKQALHRGFAAALVARRPGGANAREPLDAIVAVAHHALAGGLDEAAAAAALTAGQRLLALYALDRAEGFLEGGLAALERVAAVGDARLADYLLALGDARRFKDQVKDAEALYDRAAGLLEAAGQRRPLGRLLGSRAKVATIAADYDRALDLAAQSIAHAQATGDLAGASRGMLTAARVHFFKGARDTAREKAAEALTTAQASGEQLPIGQASAFLGYMIVATGSGDLQAGIDHLQAARDVMQAVGDLIGLNNAYNLLGNALTATGDLAAARDAFEASRRVSGDSGVKGDECVALVSLATTALELGELQLGLTRAREARTLSEAVGTRLPLGMAMAAEAVAKAWLGEVAGAEAEAPRATALARDMKNKYLESLALAYEAQAWVLLGRNAEARTATGALAELIAATGNRETESKNLSLQAELALREGKHADARALAERALARAQEARVPTDEARARVAEARALLALDQFDDANRAAEAGLAIAGRVGARAIEATARGMLGEIALARGGAADAQAHFSAMDALAQRLESPGLVAVAAFGRAAALPYGPDVQAHVARARSQLEGVVGFLDDRACAAYLAVPERKRAWDGNHVAFGQPRAGAVPARPQGFMGGGFGMM